MKNAGNFVGRGEEKLVGLDRGCKNLWTGTQGVYRDSKENDISVVFSHSLFILDQ